MVDEGVVVLELYLGYGDSWMRFDSNKLKSMLENGEYTTDIHEVNGDTFYKIYGNEIDRLLTDLIAEKERQWQEGLFLKRETLAYKDMKLLIDILSDKRRYEYMGEKVELFKMLETEDLIGDLEADLERIIAAQEKEEQIIRRRESFALVHSSPIEKE